MLDDIKHASTRMTGSYLRTDDMIGLFLRIGLWQKMLLLLHYIFFYACLTILNTKETHLNQLFLLPTEARSKLDATDTFLI